MKKLIYILLASTFLLGISCKKDKKIKGVKTVAVDGVPCSFDFNTMITNQEISVGCNHDLGGATITLPAGVKIKYNGGSIVNGIFIFNNGKIAGGLLNIDLEIQGTGTLIDTTRFEFVPERWNITRGVVTTPIALTNRENINTAIKAVTFLHGHVFEMDNFDGYFDVQAGYGGSKIENWRRCIQLPSYFHFKMGNNVNMRVQPNDKRDYILFGTWSTNETKISGGHLWGDRYTHDYVGGDTGPQDLGYGILFIGTIDGVVEDLSANKFTGDGFIISSLIKRNNDGSENYTSHLGVINYSKNLVVRNCVFDDNRRNGLALTDVEGALIENCIFSNTGNGGEYNAVTEGYSWKGYTPRYGIDLEAINDISPDGNTVYLTEIVRNVIIRNSTFVGNYHGDIDFYKSWDVDVYNNTFSRGIGVVASFDVKLHDNIFTSDGGGNPAGNKRAINITPRIRPNGSHYVKDWEVYNNTITGYYSGIIIGGENQQVYNNTISQFNEGIQLLEGLNNTLHDNKLTSTINASIGYRNFVLGNNLKGVTIINDTVNVEQYGALLISTNAGLLGTGVTFDQCYFKGYKGVEIRNCNKTTIQNTAYSNYNTVGTNTNITLNNNTIIP